MKKEVIKLELKFLKLIKLGKQELLHTLGYQQEKMSIEAQIDYPIFFDEWQRGIFLCWIMVIYSTYKT